MVDKKRPSTQQLRDDLKLSFQGSGLKTGEAEQGQSEDQLMIFKRFVEDAQDGFGYLDREGRILYANPATYRMLDEPYNADLSVKTIYDYYPDEIKKQLRAIILPTILREGKWSGDLFLKTAAGKLIPTSNHLFILKNEDGRPFCLGNVISDLTERTRTEEELKKHRDHLEDLVSERTLEIKKANSELQKEISERKRTEVLLKKSEQELKNKACNLEEANTALKVLLKQREEDRIELEEKVLSNVKKLIEPYMEKIKHLSPRGRQRIYLDIIEANLQEIISPFGRRLSALDINLSATEIQVANLIRNSRTNKEISELMHISVRTVEFHRKNIRKKLGLTNTSANLASYLSSLP